jgi:KipI family sensor histidine kinase inhibitor
MNVGMMVLDAPRVTPCGSAALLLDAEGPLALATQQRIWVLQDEVRDWDGVVDLQPGMNSLLVVIDPLAVDAEAMTARLLLAWSRVEPRRAPGRLLEVGVVYGGEGGPDLPNVAAHHGVDIDAVVTLHSGAEYVVFAPGVMPGFGYLFGLDPRLFTPRRPTPVMREAGGLVSIGGAQAGLGGPRREDRPTSSPTGWHTIGRASAVPEPFDLHRDPPNLLDLGDRIRFRVERVLR